MDADKTPPETPLSILNEIKLLHTITERVVNNTLEIKGDIKLLFGQLDTLKTQIAVTFGLASASLVLSLFAIVLSYVR